MAVYINGISLNDLLSKYNINIQEMHQTINIKSALFGIPTLAEKDFKTTLSNLSIEYTKHNSIDDYLRDLLKHE